MHASSLEHQTGSWQNRDAKPSWVRLNKFPRLKIWRNCQLSFPDLLIHFFAGNKRPDDKILDNGREKDQNAYRKSTGLKHQKARRAKAKLIKELARRQPTLIHSAVNDVLPGAHLPNNPPLLPNNPQMPQAQPAIVVNLPTVHNVLAPTIKYVRN